MSLLLDSLIEDKLKKGILSGEYLIGFYNHVYEFETFTYHNRGDNTFIVEIIYTEFDTKRDEYCKFITNISMNLKNEIRLNKLKKITNLYISI